MKLLRPAFPSRARLTRWGPALFHGAVRHTAALPAEGPPSPKGPGSQKSSKERVGGGASPKSKPLRHMYFVGLMGVAAVTGVALGQIVDIDHAKLPNAFIITDIAADLKVNFDFRPDLAPAMIRLAMVHCLGEVLGAPLLGGCPMAVGTDDPQAVLHTVTMVHKITQPDAVTLAAVLAIEYLGGPKIMWRCGRREVKRKRRDKAPEPKVPVPHSVTGTLDEWLSVFAAIGFTPKDFVALVGAHGVGGMAFTGPQRLQWTRDRYRFNNSYYRTLMATKYKPPAYDTGGIYVGVGPDAMKKNLGALPWEAAMVTHPLTAAHVKAFAADEAEWTAHFTMCFIKMCELGEGCSTLREYIPPPNFDRVRAMTRTTKDGAILPEESANK